MNQFGYVYIGAVLGVAGYIAWQRIRDIDERLRTIEGERMIARLNDAAARAPRSSTDSAKG